jgi:hypothetical protein
MRSGHEDFTAQGILEGAYSFDRPAHIIGNALINGFIRAGMSKEQAINLFYSKATRWALDGGLGTSLEDIAFIYGKTMAHEWKGEKWLNDPLPANIQNQLDQHNQREAIA